MDSVTFHPNNKGWKIKTPSGFLPFSGVTSRPPKQMFRVSLDDGSFIDATANHTFYTSDDRDIFVHELSPGVELGGESPKTVVSVDGVGCRPTFDIFNVQGHRFFANKLLSHNCEMLSTDPLLFDSLVLTNLTAVTDKITPIGTAGDIVFYEQPQPGASYLVGVDPATGSGNDFATIQVFSFPAMEQVAEWRSNTVSSVILYHTLKKILLLLEKNESTVYFSVENNGVGEALIALYTADEHPPSADFVSEDGQKRQGMTTTGRSKIQACLSFKDMIERGAMTIRSSNLLKEMKNYARKAGSYAAKRGATDDLIAACLIVVRLVTEISSYDDDAYNKLYAGAHHVEAEDIDYDDSDYGVDFVM